MAETLRSPLTRYPDRLASVRHTCPFCQHSFQPPWVELRPDAIIPIKPLFDKDRKPYNGPGRYIPLSVQIKCPQCQKHSHFPVPSEKFKGIISLYGDESHQQKDGWKVSIYSLVGADSRELDTINTAVRNLKKKACPTANPDSWNLHMRQLRSGHQRRKHPVFRQLSREQQETLVEDLFRICAGCDSLFKYNICVLTSGDAVAAHTRDKAFINLLTLVIDQLTGAGGSPHLFLDNDKSSGATHVLRQWCSDLFARGQRCLLYSYLAKGIEIPFPRFVRPAFAPCSELADFLSYVIARFYWRKWHKLPPDLLPEKLGRVTYSGFETGGDLRFHSTIGYPWELFYGNAE